MSRKELIMRNKRAAVAALIAGAAYLKNDGRKPRKIWSREWLQRREERGCYENLMRELALEDQEGYHRCLRMTTDDFQYLLQKVSSLISKKVTCMRKPILAEERLALTLRFLATGETQSSLHFQFRIAQNTISTILPEVCWAIYQTLREEFLVMPASVENWIATGHRFDSLWNFPMCVGAIDGKHVAIVPPADSAADYRNYKGFFSIILLAVANADLVFSYVDVGTNGRFSDGAAWRKCSLKSALERECLNLPPAEVLPGTNSKVPYVLVADDAFPLTSTIMKPFSGKDLPHWQRIYNYRLSRARRVVENAFGVLAARFRLLKTCIEADVDNIKLFVLAACTLHNFLRTRSKNVYLPPGSVDQEDVQSGVIHRGNWRSDPGNLLSGQPAVYNASHEAKEVQKRFASYFCSVGAVEWQDRMCFLH